MGDEYDYANSEVGKMYEKDVGDGTMAFVEINLNITVSSSREITGHERDRLEKLEHILKASVDEPLRDRGFRDRDGGDVK